MFPLQGIESLPSNMGTVNGIEKVKTMSSSLKLNNNLPNFVAIAYFHQNLNSSFKAIMGYFYC
jgi:hypothetical protein